MCFTFLRNALKFSSEGVLQSIPFFWTLKCQPRKSNPSVVAVTLVFLSLTFIPRSAKNSLIRLSITSASSFGLRIITISSAYRIDGSNQPPLVLYSCKLSIPLSAMLASSGLTTPPCGVPWSGNPIFVPALRHRKIPSFNPEGAIRLSMIAEWLIRSKHFSISNSITRLLIPFTLELRLSNRYFWALCAERPVLNP